jgi:hypothetical protein
MIKRLVATVMVCFSLTPVAAFADSLTPPPGPPSGEVCGDAPFQPQCAAAGGSKGTIDVSGAGGEAGSPGEGGSGSTPVRLSKNITRYDYVLACSGNTLANGGDINCMAAISICAGNGPGYLAYWQYEAEFVRATGAIVPPGWQRVNTVCLAPGSPLLNPLAAIPGIIERDFRSLVVLKGTAISQPGGSTLVNYKTGFYTDARRYTLDPVGILGHTVVITAEPAQYDWYFGDGTDALDGGPGAKDTLDVQHTYTRNGKVAPYVVITWTGTFTVDGGPARQVIGTATTTGPGTPLQVKQARAELVTR